VDAASAPERLRVLPSWLLAQTALVAQQRVGARLAAVDAHRSHYGLLAALAEGGPASQADLGRRIGLDRSDMVALVDGLAEAGQVRRAPDPADRRRNTVSLTAAGRRRLKQLDQVVAAAQDELLAGLSDRQRSQFVRLLTTVLDGAAGRDEPGTA
jgi:DNA-binding MarR family transcriptional regulator